MNHCQLTFFTKDEDLRGRLIANLDEAGFTAFEETDVTLLAFIPESLRSDVAVDALLPEPLRWEEAVISPQNWNAVWESSFEPVTVPGFCTVRAAFHPADPHVPHEIIITPKMSFGTGHHATTRMMIRAMQDLELSGRRVLDFGTGTGILAILAQQLGAVDVLAIDNDAWSVENSLENVAANAAGAAVRVREGSLEVADGAHYDVILANINRHILLANMSRMRGMLVEGGTLLLSGIFAADREMVTASAIGAGMREEGILAEGDWISLRFTV